MWVLGDYVVIVEELLVLFGLILVFISGICCGDCVFDVVVGLGNVLILVVMVGVYVIVSDLMFELLCCV